MTHKSPKRTLKVSAYFSAQSFKVSHSNPTLSTTFYSKKQETQKSKRMAHFQTDERFFTKDWTITLPSRPEPNLKFIRLTPAETTAFIRFAEGAVSPPASKSAEAPHAEPQARPALIPGERMQRMYAESQTRHHALDVFISLDNKFVGWGGVTEITAPDEKPSVANIGIMLSPEVQGKGLGKTLMQVLLRLSNEVKADIIEAGTMKDNTSMRAMAKSVGLVETDEIKEMPGQGVVAEVLFKNIEKEKWRDLDMVVEFRDQIASGSTGIN
jgi:RimJ/RimL family protein N-acetyltransferase